MNTDMDNIISLTNIGTADTDTVNIKLSSIVLFLFVYPELISSTADITIIDLGKYITDIETFGTTFILTDLPINTLFKAVAAWLEIVILAGEASKQNPSKIIIDVDINNTTTLEKISANTNDITELLKLLNSSEMYKVFRFTIANKFKNITNQNALHNIAILRKVVERCWLIH